jgi:hypothetical protein
MAILKIARYEIIQSVHQQMNASWKCILYAKFSHKEKNHNVWRKIDRNGNYHVKQKRQNSDKQILHISSPMWKADFTKRHKIGMETIWDEMWSKYFIYMPENDLMKHIMLYN